MKIRRVPKKKFRKKIQNQVEMDTGDRKRIEIKGVMYLALGVLLFFSFFFHNSVGLFGKLITNVLFGMMGISAYFFTFAVLYFGWMFLFKKGLDQSKLRQKHAIVLIGLLSALFQTAYYRSEVFESINFVESIARFYQDGLVLGGGGVVGGIISMPLIKVFQPLGTIVIITAIALVEIVILTEISLEELVLKTTEKVKKLIRYMLYLLHNIKTRNRAKTLIQFDPEEEAILQRNLQEERGEQQKRRLLSILKMNEADLIKEKEKKESLLEIKKKAKNTLVKIKKGLVSKQEEKTSSEKNILPNEENRIEKKQECDTISTREIDIEINKNNLEIENYKLPSFHLLQPSVTFSKSKDASKLSILENAKKLEETLQSFGVDAKVINFSNGPAVTRYELAPSPGVKVSKIVSLSDDIALNLATSGLRIEAPIPGKAAVGIEVPNREVQAVTLREVIESKEFKDHASKVSIAVGKDISGQCVIADIAKMPHLLIAGATGAGKSVCINTIIMSILYKATPQEVKLVMIDPKVVELGIYNGIPHLLIPVVTEPKKAAGALNWAVLEMINRYKWFADKGVRDIEGYNKVMSRENPEGKLPQIVIIIDELADLMMVAPHDVEDAICRLAQMARAAGMHLVIATQRPSVDVITGVIKANIPSRIAFAVSSHIDSRTILDMAGAEKLLGKGDMLFSPIGEHKPLRVKGAFVTEKEVEAVVQSIKEQETTQYDESVMEEINQGTIKENSQEEDKDELLPQAIELVVDAGHASVSMIQRRFKVGYARAARIIDQMELRGIVGAFEGSKPRQVLLNKQEWVNMKLEKEVNAH